MQPHQSSERAPPRHLIAHQFSSSCSRHFKQQLVQAAFIVILAHSRQEEKSAQLERELASMRDALSDRRPAEPRGAADADIDVSA